MKDYWLGGAVIILMVLSMGMAPTVANAQAFDVGKALKGIESGCQYNYDAVQRIYDAYGAEAKWIEGGAGRWVPTVRKPEGGRALSPVLGHGMMTINKAEGASIFAARIEGAAWHGMPLLGLEWTQGLGNGISIFSVQLALPPDAAKAQLRAKGVKLRSGQEDDMGMVFTPMLRAVKGKPGASELICDRSM